MEWSIQWIYGWFYYENSIAKKMFLIITAGATLQAGSSVYAGSQLGALYESGYTAATKALKEAGGVVDKISQHETVQQLAAIAETKFGKCAAATAFLAGVSGYLMYSICATCSGFCNRIGSEGVVMWDS